MTTHLTDTQSETYKGVCYFQARQLLETAGAPASLIEIVAGQMADTLSDQAYEMFAKLSDNYNPEAN